MEAAGLALGVVPVIIAAARAYRTLNDRLHTLRHHHRVAHRLWLSFRCIQARFRDTFRHFLAQVLQKNDPWQLMQENALSAKQQDQIAAHIDQSLGADSAALFTDVFKEISVLLDEARDSLVNIKAAADSSVSEHPVAFPDLNLVLLLRKDPKSSLKTSKKALNVTFHESQYESQLDKLRKWIGDICYLLSTKGNTPKEDHRAGSQQPLPLPSSVTAINEASRQLGVGLDKAWTCLNATHGSHSAALRLDSKLDMNDAVHMNVAISCRPCTTHVLSKSSQTIQTSETQLWLHIRSVYPNVMRSEQKSQKRVRISTAISSPTARDSSRASHNIDPPENATLQIPKNSSTRNVRPMSQELIPGPKSNLDDLPSLCCHLCAVNFSRPFGNSKCCHSSIGMAKGYLNTAPGYEHIIFDHSGTKSTSDNISPSLAKDSCLVTDYLTHMTTAQQLKTAYEVTMGVLKYNHTPWLKDEWSLSDLSYLGSSSYDHTTLHVTKRLPKKKSRGLVAIDDTAEATTTPKQELRTLLGVRNAPLAGLGHALLELAHRKPLEDLRQPGDPHNTVAARRLVIFGPKYRRIVRKCLEADFVVDCTDLSDGRLRTAVYNNVALELDSLAKDFERITRLA